MKEYIEWLKENPEIGYYWVKSGKEQYVDVYDDFYDDSGNLCTMFLVQPDSVICKVLSPKEQNKITRQNVLMKTVLKRCKQTFKKLRFPTEIDERINEINKHIGE